MRVAVLSDTHLPRRGHDLPPRAWEVIAGCSAVIHAGDVVERGLLERLASVAPLHAVRGNNDTDLPDLPDTLSVELGGVSIVVVHDSGPAAGRRLRLRRRHPQARVIVFGHSHIPLVDDDGDLLLLNPGSPTDRRAQPTFTMALLDVADGVASAAIVDLGLERASANR
jgi:putative phosphoesterase